MKSIRMKLMFSILLIIIIFTAALLVGNTFFLEKYYVFQTESHFVDAYEMIEATDRKDNAVFNEKLLELNRETGYRINILDNQYNIVYTTDGGDTTSLSKTQLAYLTSNKQMLETDQYIYGVVKYENNINNDVQLAARIGQGQTIIITQPMRQLVENARIANSFSIIISIIMLLISIVLAFLLSRHLVKPILEINDIATDISKLKFSNRYQKKGNDEINHLGENINNISEKLSEAIDDLKASNEKLVLEMENQKNFFANVSHEIKTPVGLIRGYTEAMKLGIDNDEHEKMQEIVIKESDHLSHLLDDMINQIRISSGHFKIVREETDITEIISDVIESHQINIEDKAVDISFTNDEPITVTVDYNRMRQVFDNLISNAIKYSPEYSQIYIHVENKKSRLYFEISNEIEGETGIDIIRIFEPFYRADNKSTENKKGTGLGLAVVKAIIEAHEGKCYALINDKRLSVNFEV